jgi:ubiquinone/menaquinone biosynthesis C-methylase UbiE
MTTVETNPGQGRFNRWASSYDRTILQRLLFEPVHDAVLGAFSAEGAPPRDVLDVGCGTGRLLETCAGRWNSVHFTGIDASGEMIAEARRKHEGDARYVFEQCDASALPLESDSFDVAFSTISFHHWRDKAAGLREIARVLRPGGLFVLADIDPPFLSLLRPFIKWHGHATFQGPDAIERLLEQAGLSVLTRRRFWPLFRVQLFVARKGALSAHT